MNKEELWYWVFEGSRLVRVLALALLDEKTDGEVTKLYRDCKK